MQAGRMCLRGAATRMRFHANLHKPWQAGGGPAGGRRASVMPKATKSSCALPALITKKELFLPHCARTGARRALPYPNRPRHACLRQAALDQVSQTFCTLPSAPWAAPHRSASVPAHSRPCSRAKLRLLHNSYAAVPRNGAQGRGLAGGRTRGFYETALQSWRAVPAVLCTAAMKVGLRAKQGVRTSTAR